MSLYVPPLYTKQTVYTADGMAYGYILRSVDLTATTLVPFNINGDDDLRTHLHFHQEAMDVQRFD